MPPAPPTKGTSNPRPSEPRNHAVFDPWNSASTGHQRAENPYAATKGWRDTRSRKLKRQFRDGDCVRDTQVAAQAFDGTCGPGSTGGDADNSISNRGEWKWVSEAEATRAHLGVRDIRSFMGVSKRKAGDEEQQQEKKKQRQTPTEETEKGRGLARQGADGRVWKPELAAMPSVSAGGSVAAQSVPTTGPEEMRDADAESEVFAGTTVYVNGSTLPQISDHRLKQLLVAHGAQVSTFMMRKTVSHVIIGQPNGVSGKASAVGAGGGLASGKLQQEIARGGWKGVKIVGVDWVLESIKARRRLAESRFAVLQVAPKGQRSVVGMFGSR
ncbi:uncharacterized protein N7459_002087 [Penicillium hispanicum]|uniref:uncharacterized protein n=1 Tax=Penicillium hispanicum TaxID=1080232 RepID=UPI00254032A2|nr:uncharacterized protein N7459_002087 [Penicillium hispanicum]KAJ5591718.1 hypothetical protein N7459_002087 [Penicillium hispanicum]